MAAVPYSFGYSNTTAVERQPLYGTSIWWQNLNNVPADSTVIGSAFKTVSAQFYTSSDNGVTFNASGPFFGMIPGNFGNGVSYRPLLTDAAHRTIRYDPSVWVADCELRVLQFGRPVGVLGYSPPFTLEYKQYDGGTPTFPEGITVSGNIEIISPNIVIAAPPPPAISGVGNIFIGKNTSISSITGNYNTMIGWVE